MLSSPKPITKPSATRFLHQLQGTLEQASKAETIPSLQLLSQRLQTLKSKLSKGMKRRQQFQDLISKCETLVKQKLRNAKIKGKYLSPPNPSLKKHKSEEEFRMTPKYLESTGEQMKGNKRSELGDETREEYRNESEEEYREWNQKLGDIRREIKREKEEKGKLRSKMDQLKNENKVKAEELEYLRDNVSKLAEKVEKIESKKEMQEVFGSHSKVSVPPPQPNLNSSHPHIYPIPNEMRLPPRSPKQQNTVSRNITSPLHSKTNTNQLRYNLINPSIKSLHHSHNLYTLQKQHLIHQFQDRINQKNSIILHLQHHIATLQLQNTQLKSNTSIKSTQMTESVESLRMMLRSSNDKLESAIKEKSDLKEVIKQLQIKNEVFAVEIQKLIREGNRCRQEIQKKDKIMDFHIYEEKRAKEMARRGHNECRHQVRDTETENDKVLLFQRLDAKDKEISGLKQDLIKVRHDIDLITLTLRMRQDKILELEQIISHRSIEREVDMNMKRVELARTKSQQFNSTLKNNCLREEARRTEANVNKSLDITRKLNALEGIRNIIRRFPHGQS